MNPLAHGWVDLFGFDQGLAAPLALLISLLGVFLFAILPSTLFMAYADRKITADLQARVGPNRAGPLGVLQPLADFLKHIQKRKSVSPSSFRWLWVHTMALYATTAVLPLSSQSILVNSDMSVFLPFLSVITISLCLLLFGLSQGNVSGWFGGVRGAAQALSGAFPALVALLCVGLQAGGFQWNAILAAQGATPFGWTVFSNPFEPIAFLSFVISGLIFLGIPPLDGNLTSMELHGGVSAPLYGTELTLVRFARSYGFFMWSVLSVSLFLGGWKIPAGLIEAFRLDHSPGLLHLCELVLLLIKVQLFMLLVVVVSRVTPRVRSDQISDLAWRVLSPLSLLALVGSAFWVAWGAL